MHNRHHCVNNDMRYLRAPRSSVRTTDRLEQQTLIENLHSGNTKGDYSQYITSQVIDADAYKQHMNHVAEITDNFTRMGGITQFEQDDIPDVPWRGLSRPKIISLPDTRA